MYLDAYKDLALTHHKNKRSIKYIHEALAEKVHLRTIQRWIKDFVDSNKTDQRTSSGRCRNVVTFYNKQRVKKLTRNNKFSGRKCARVLQVSESSVRRMMQELDLNVYDFFYIETLLFLAFLFF